MTTAVELLRTTTGRLAPDPAANRLVPLIARGAARRETLAALALEEREVVAADRRAFLHLAGRPDAGPECAAYFRALAEGEEEAGRRLGPLLTACGADRPGAADAHEPLAGCRAYPAYVAWLALNADPVDVVLALTANFAAWGGYCETVARALRQHYGFDDEACAFFDLFAGPAPDLEHRAQAAVRAGLEAGRVHEDLVHRYGRLLRSYESMFWHTLWETDRERGERTAGR
ncbi:hypothetical protein GCM10010358_35370 [Streptomyces minutiscleroticus]|uniref:Uncharacterized protein n=1 Tax=Streptomyces minutiscleroticus TaxID=68238 RepID=A0A918NL40_9ACTN|nr:transcriptional regulator [Streptomyces minutiscleroticus]GGX77920.1 hypothetical protein GCM10010358_35370 [Streptomyces minutiscleroticus]